MAGKYRIVSEDGRTTVFDEDGKQIKMVKDLKIEFSPRCVIAYVTLIVTNPEIDVVAEVGNDR